MDENRTPGIGSLIERGLALAVVALVLLGILAVLQPFATAILFGSILAIAAWPLRDALVARGFGRGSAAALLLLVVLLVAVVPLLLIAPGLVGAIRGGSVTLQAALVAAPLAPPDWLVGLPLVGGQLEALWLRVAEARGDVGPLLEPYADRIQAMLLAVAGGLADSALQILLALIVATMLWSQGDAIGEALSDSASRLGGTTGVNALHAAGAAVRAVAYGVVGTAAAQGLLAGIGYAIAGVPAPALLGFLTLVFSVTQILGPLVVVTWAGAAWWLYDGGHTAWAIFLGLWGLIVISGSDNILRPLLIKRGVEMPLSLIILGVFGGFVAFGFLGLFSGPVLLAVGLVMLRAWRAAERNA
jgi:predicted PurR-regulated permease PerM